jgi:nitrogen fixation/metabolism regulation signal transduction histidine kinase
VHKIPKRRHETTVSDHDRIAGPLPKIYAALRKVGEGDLNQKVILRKGDELRDLAQAVNDMIDGLKKNR